MKNKLLIIAGFIVFGVLLGVWNGWWDEHHDTPLFLDLPGYYLGIILTVKVLPSAIAWGVIGAALALLLKPKVIAWVMGVYLIAFGGLTLTYLWGWSGENRLILFRRK